MLHTFAQRPVQGVFIHQFRAIRDSVVIGKKNWSFAESMERMRANATMYSLAQTAKAPIDYLRHVLSRLPLLSTTDAVESLLPWNVLLPRRAC